MDLKKEFNHYDAQKKRDSPYGTIHLLPLTNGVKQYYCLVRDLNRLLYDQTNDKTQILLLFLFDALLYPSQDGVHKPWVGATREMLELKCHKKRVWNSQNLKTRWEHRYYS